MGIEMASRLGWMSFAQDIGEQDIEVIDLSRGLLPPELFGENQADRPQDKGLQGSQIQLLAFCRGKNQGSEMRAQTGGLMYFGSSHRLPKAAKILAATDPSDEGAEGSDSTHLPAKSGATYVLEAIEAFKRNDLQGALGLYLQAIDAIEAEAKPLRACVDALPCGHSDRMRFADLLFLKGRASMEAGKILESLGRPEEAKTEYRKAASCLTYANKECGALGRGRVLAEAEMHSGEYSNCARTCWSVAVNLERLLISIKDLPPSDVSRSIKVEISQLYLMCAYAQVLDQFPLPYSLVNASNALKEGLRWLGILKQERIDMPHLDEQMAYARELEARVAKVNIYLQNAQRYFSNQGGPSVFGTMNPHTLKATLENELIPMAKDLMRIAVDLPPTNIRRMVLEVIQDVAGQTLRSGNKLGDDRLKETADRLFDSLAQLNLVLGNFVDAARAFERRPIQEGTPDEMRLYAEVRLRQAAVKLVGHSTSEIAEMRSFFHFDLGDAQNLAFRYLFPEGEGEGEGGEEEERQREDSVWQLLEQMAASIQESVNAAVERQKRVIEREGKEIPGIPMKLGHLVGTERRPSEPIDMVLAIRMFRFQDRSNRSNLPRGLLIKFGITNLEELDAVKKYLYPHVYEGAKRVLLEQIC